jgi:hypothetical protein
MNATDSLGKLAHESILVPRRREYVPTYGAATSHSILPWGIVTGRPRVASSACGRFVAYSRCREPRSAPRYGKCVPVVAAAVCPHPPLLVPELASGAAGELDGLRTVCRAAIDAAMAVSPAAVVMVGAGERYLWHEAGEFGSLHPWGVPVVGRLGGRPEYGAAGGSLPLSLTVGAWLLGSVSRPVRGLSVPADTPAEDCRALGRTVADTAETVALVVMADGSIARNEKAPGYVDPRAEPFDAAVAEALAAGDPEALGKIDAQLAAELGCSGRAAWQVLAGACAGRTWRAALHYAEAPYGVGYFVASWT